MDFTGKVGVFNPQYRLFFVALLGSRAFALFDNGAGDAVLTSFLFYEAVVLGHAFGRALGFDFCGGRGCIHVTCSLCTT